MMIRSDKWKTMLAAEAGKTGISLSPDQADRLSVHAHEVIQANRKFNLTSITDPLEVMAKHVVDSLAVTRYIEKRNARIIDVGTGGGFPGIPIKIAMPEADLTLVDKSRKKVSFLNYIIRKLGLDGIRAVNARVEDMRADDPDKGFDVAVSRAFTSLNNIAAFVLPMLKSAGEIIAMKGASVKMEVDEFQALSGISAHVSVYNYTLPLLNLSRAVVLIGRQGSVKPGEIPGRDPEKET